MFLVSTADVYCWLEGNYVRRKRSMRSNTGIVVENSETQLFGIRELFDTISVYCAFDMLSNYSRWINIEIVIPTDEMERKQSIGAVHHIETRRVERRFLSISDCV